MLRAATACTFSTSQLLKVLQRWCVLYILTWKRASCHNGVYFFDVSTSKSAPKLKCFAHFDLETCFVPQRCATFHLSFGQLALASLLFDPLELQIFGKTQCFATFLPFFAHLHLLSSEIFFVLFFSSLTLPISAFHLSISSEA